MNISAVSRAALFLLSFPHIPHLNLKVNLAVNQLTLLLACKIRMDTSMSKHPMEKRKRSIEDDGEDMEPAQEAESSDMEEGVDDLDFVTEPDANEMQLDAAANPFDNLLTEIKYNADIDPRHVIIEARVVFDN